MYPTSTCILFYTYFFNFHGFLAFQKLYFIGLCALRHEKHRIYHTRWDITAVLTHTDHYFVFNRTLNSSPPLLSVQTKESLVIIWLAIASFLKISINCRRAARGKTNSLGKTFLLPVSDVLFITTSVWALVRVSCGRRCFVKMLSCGRAKRRWKVRKMCLHVWMCH